MTGDALNKAREQEQLGDFAAAERAYQEILSCNPEDVQVLRLLGINLWRQDRLAEAASTLRQAIGHDSGNSELHSLLGVVLAIEGHTSEAGESFRRVIAIDPGRADGYYNLANLHSQAGESVDALRYFRLAIEQRPDFAEAHFNLGNELRRQNELDAAASCFESALALRPAYSKARNNLVRTLVQLGKQHHEQGRLDAALEASRRATAIAPDQADAWVQVGLILAARDEHQEAAAAYQRALAIQPDLAVAYVNLAVSQRARSDLAGAEQSLRSALFHNPEMAEAYCNLADILVQHDRPDEALAQCRRAQQLDPDLLAAVVNEAVALVALGREDEAILRYQRLLKLEPHSPVYHYNLGLIYLRQAMWSEASECLQRALAAKPDYAEAHASQALLKLEAGEMLAGWEQYEWRWKCREFADHSLAGCLWDGSCLEDAAILLQAEQGLGDTIQFVRFAQQLKRLGVKVLLQCQRPLQTILSSLSGVDRLVARGDPLPEFDFYAPLMSLPRLLGVTVEDIPSATSYLSADEALVEHWRNELSAHAGFRIGVVWQSNVENRRLRARSFPLAELAPLARLTDVQLISLQKHAGTEQLPSASGQFSVINLGEDFDEVAGPFMDTAAVMRCLDLVVCCDTAVGHLAGALGVETWLALPHPANWRWFREREDSPWYPSHRLFRQTTRGVWSDVFARMADALEQRLG